MGTRGLPVVVGVDGSEQSERAVRYALEEARRREVGLTLVHAVHETAPMAAMLPLYSVEAFTEVGRRLVADAASLARSIDAEITVETVVRSGSRVGTLVELGEHASVVVLGHRSRSLAGRALASSTTTGVAARAHCPVVSVPDGWAGGSPRGRVVVGVDQSAASHDALDLAFREARRRGAKLVALHAWRLPNTYDAISYAQSTIREWMAAAAEEMEKVMAPFRDAYPDVEAEADPRHDFPGPALVSASEGADLVVMGRRGHGAPWGVYLGSLSRMMVREGRCPVEIAPQHPRGTPPAEERLLGGQDDISPQT